MTAALDAAPLPPDTTAEQDLKTHGQRRINLIWEMTQAVVAMSVTLTVLFVCGWLITHGNSEGAFLLLSNAFFWILATYFQRTNHTKTGGISGKDDR